MKLVHKAYQVSKIMWNEFQVIKSRSGKILRGTVRKIADKEEYKMPATIDDPKILDEIKEELVKNNILK